MIDLKKQESEKLWASYGKLQAARELTYAKVQSIEKEMLIFVLGLKE